MLLPGLVNTHHHFFQTLREPCRQRRTPSSSAGCARCIRYGKGSLPRCSTSRRRSRWPSSSCPAAPPRAITCTCITARDALLLATRGGARVLGRDDIGQLAAGMAADVVAFDLDDIAGAQHDPLAALVFCAPAHAWHVGDSRSCRRARRRACDRRDSGAARTAQCAGAPPGARRLTGDDSFTARRIRSCAHFRCCRYSLWPAPSVPG